MTKKGKDTLTAKQEKFCQEYVKTGNKTAAYKASYSTKNQKSTTINENASRLYANSKILARVEYLQKKIAERNNISIDECVQLLTAMARFDIADLYDENGAIKPITQIPKETRLVIESLESEDIAIDGKVIGRVRKLKTSSRRANIIELMKHLGGYEKDNKQKVQTIPTREERDAFLKEFEESVKKNKK